MTKPATDEQATLWHCAECSSSGVLLLEPHADVYSVVNGLEDAHKAQAPDCEASIGRLRVTRPNGWFKSLTDLAEEAVKVHQKKSARHKGPL